MCMSDVKTRLRRYPDETPLVTVDEIVWMVEKRSGIGSTRRRPVAWWRGPQVAIATAVAVLIVLGAAVLALRGEGTGVTDAPPGTRRHHRGFNDYRPARRDVAF